MCDTLCILKYRGIIGDRATGPDGFPMVFQIFWEDIKQEIMNFMFDFLLS